MLSNIKGNTLSEGEVLQSKVVEELLHQVSSLCACPVELTTKSKLRGGLEWVMATLSTFTAAAQNGEYDIARPARKVSHFV